MTNIHFATKRTLAVISCVSLVSMLAACGTNKEYYDANGKHISSDSPYDARSFDYPNSGITHDVYAEQTKNKKYSEYDHDGRRGYYDRKVEYTTADDGLNVPENMFPPRGMCRVWFTDRRPAKQPVA